MSGRFVCVYVLNFVLITYVRKASTSMIDSFQVLDINGRERSMADFAGQVRLIVNVASQCGYTDIHYRQLVALFDKHRESHKFTVLAFPSNQFGAQEPEDNSNILNFARKGYAAYFPMFSKIDVIGANAAPLYKYLADETGQVPDWNFWKYLVNKEGKVLKALGPWVNVDDMKSEIEDLIYDRRGEL